MELTRISRKYGHIPITATLHDGNPATITGVDVALLPSGATPDGDTAWTATDYTNGEAVVLLAGPDADPAGALVATATGDLWARITDSPEVDAANVGRIRIR